MELILFCGLQGSGKSSFYHQNFANTHLRINLDMLRTRKREAAVLHACLSHGQRCVIDNTNPTPEDRARYIVPAKAAHFKVVAFHFGLPFQECVERNAKRTDKKPVPNAGMRSVASKLVPPALTEGIDAIHVVNAEGEAVVQASSCDAV